jgi:hypothetical protein
VNTTLSSLVLTATVAVATWSSRAEACGCFAPPDPSVPIVQAGERILFATANGKVTAHIQIQYAGNAKDFGWLLPVPSVPTLKLGTEELFTQLIATTQPRYFVQVKSSGNCSGGNLGFGAAPSGSARSSAAEATDDSGASPLVIQSSIGPYDYAVLKADNKDAMLKWLADNRYFIPVGTEDVVGPYINPGSFFLALKLQSGKAAGDIQPVVLEYPSEKPMIPIILTSVAAQPNMGIQVWMLGEGRAIPRNYRHVVINDAQLNWFSQAQNYNDVVIKAISEAPEKHAFITEYAGTSAVMKDVLDPASRFGALESLAAKNKPGEFIQHLFDNGFVPVPANQLQSGRGFQSQQVLPPNLKALVLGAIPFPQGLAGVTTEDEFLRRASYYLGEYRELNPARFVGYQLAFNPSALAMEIFEKIVRPVREAGALFKAYPTLTRLYTALSPQDMNRDPVFSYNPSLPEVSRDHNAIYEVNCGLAGDTFSSPGRLITEQGWSIKYPAGRNGAPEATFASGPSALRIETLAEEGSPLVELDNSAPIGKLVSCSVVDPAGLGVLALVAFLRRRRVN